MLEVLCTYSTVCPECYLAEHTVEFTKACKLLTILYIFHWVYESMFQKKKLIIVFFNQTIQLKLGIVRKWFKVCVSN